MSNKKEEIVAVVATTPTATVAPGEAELSTKVTNLEKTAAAIVIENDEQYQAAAEFGRNLKNQSAAVTEFFAPIKKAAHEAHKQVCNREKEMLKPIGNAEKILKRTMSAYQQKVQEEQRKAEEERRKQEEAEKARLMAEAIAAEESGNTAAADEMFENAQMVEVAQRTPVAAPKPVRATGTAVITSWEIESIDLSKVPVEFMNQIIRPVDTAAVMRLIRESKGSVQIPGIKYKEVQNIQFRR